MEGLVVDRLYRKRWRTITNLLWRYVFRPCWQLQNIGRNTLLADRDDQR